MKYAVLVVADQTYAFLIRDDAADPFKWCFTTKHQEASLWDSRDEAEEIAKRAGEDVIGVEEVEDEAAWRAQEDTW